MSQQRSAGQAIFEISQVMNRTSRNQIESVIHEYAPQLCLMSLTSAA